MRRLPVALVAAAVTALALAGPAQASAAPTVVPSPGKWAGLSDTTACNTLPATDITESSRPDESDCALPLSLAMEAVDFKIAGRRITALAFDIVIQCHPSDTDHWTYTSMRFTSGSGWGYVVLGGASTAVRTNSVLRMTFPVEENIAYPAGEVKATFDFRGSRAKVALFYDGTLTEPGFTNHCISQMNRPSVIPVQKRI